MNNNIQNASERRKYIRLDTIFPVEFQLVGKEDREPLSELREGFTKNVGKGGMGIFAKTLEEQDIEFFNFVPHETKLKLIINIPSDREPVECFATVEWIERQAGPIMDTYLFGVSYDFINEIEYEKIMDYVKWLHLKPKLIFLTIILLAIAFVFSFILLFKINVKRAENEKKLMESIVEGKQVKAEKVSAEKKKSKAEAVLEAVEKEYKSMQSAYEKLANEKDVLEKVSTSSEEDNKELQLRLEELTEERAALEEQIKKESTEGGKEAEIIEEVPPAKETKAAEAGGTGISAERLKAEGVNYNNFRALILNEKMLSLDAYLSAHRSSIYHAAALFALAELRYMHGERALSVVNYNEIIELYPKSKYALYSSHRLEQLRKNYNYDYYTLKDFYVAYNLPELFDYRNIEPYVR
jgi:TolA-binding protein